MSNWVYCTLFTSVRILTADINWQKPAKILAISSESDHQIWRFTFCSHTQWPCKPNCSIHRTQLGFESWESFVSRYCVKFQDDIMISSYFMVRSLASAPSPSCSSSESARKLNIVCHDHTIWALNSTHANVQNLIAYILSATLSRIQS